MSGPKGKGVTGFDTTKGFHFLLYYPLYGAEGPAGMGEALASIGISLIETAP